MAHQDQSSGNKPSTRPLDEEVVRLPVPENERSATLEEMPAPGSKKVRLQPDPRVDLFDGEIDEALEASAAEFGVAWEERERRSHRSTPMGWLFLIGLMLLVLGGWALVSLSAGEAHHEAVISEELVRRDKAAQEERDARALLDEAERVTRLYLAAETVEAKAAYVRHRERVLPLMREFYSRRELTSVRFEFIQGWTALGLENYPFFLLSARVEGNSRPIPLFLEHCADGELKFDWESEVGYQPMDIAKFIAEKPTDPMDFRVYASKDNFFGYEFQDEEKYQPLMLTFRDTDEFLFAYMEKGTVEERGLTAYLDENDSVGQPVLLRLRFLPGTRSRRSVLVEKVVAPRWVHIKDEKTASLP